MDNYLIKNNFAITKKKWFAWHGSGILPIKESIFPKVVLIGSLFILGMTLMTNQIFHGGVWGTLHNKSVKPKLEITEGKITNNILSFDVFRTEGVDVYGSWVIGIELFDNKNNTILEYSQEDLATLKNESISNYYVAKIKPGKHSLIVPLGAKAKLNLDNEALSSLSKGRVFGQQLEKGHVTAVAVAIGGQGHDTCRNLCSSREIGKPNLSEL